MAATTTTNDNNNKNDSSNSNSKRKVRSRETRVRQAKTMVQDAFYDIDTNRDGIITSKDLRDSLEQVGISLTSEQLRQLMHTMHRDKDGVIDLEDFEQHVQDLPEINPKAIWEQQLADEVFYEDAFSEYTPPRMSMNMRVRVRRTHCKRMDDYDDFDHDYEDEDDVDDIEETITITKDDAASSALFWSALLKKLYSGSIAGVVSRTVTAPIDRLKVALQVSSGNGMIEEIQTIYRQGGGFKAFFRGNLVNCIKIAPETCIKFIGFEFYKNQVSQDIYNPTSMERFRAGAMAGATAQVLIYPLEIVKTRLQLATTTTTTTTTTTSKTSISSSSSSSSPSSLGSIFRSLVQENGIRGLYTGLGPSLVGIIPYAGIDLAVNSILKEAVGDYLARQGIGQPSITILLGCGMISSTTAMFLTYPLNLVRTRLQSSGMPGRPQYKGAMDCIRQTYYGSGSNGSIRAFYRGIFPNLIKVLPATSISYTVYDLLQRQGGGGKQSSRQ